MKITNYEPVNEKFRKAYFTIQIPEWGGLEINFCSLFEKGDQRWISFHPKHIGEENGKHVYKPIVGLKKGMQERLDGAVLEALKTLTNGAESDSGS